MLAGKKKCIWSWPHDLFIMVIDDNLNPYMRVFLSDREGMALIVPDYNSQGRLLEFYLHTKDVNVQPH